MNISHLNSLPSYAYAVNSIKESALSSTTAQVKKIALIVAIAFGFLAALCAAIHSWAKATTVNGQHKITRPNGTVEEGMFVYGNLNGKGKRITPSGVISEGEFMIGFLHGQGKITYNGEIWEGKFVKGDLIKGKITKKNGDFEEGEFTGKLGDEKLNGKGRRVRDNTIYDGHWENGSFRGIGTYTLIRQGIVFEGNFVDGCLQGHAKRTFPGDCIEEGNFEVLNTNGKITNEMHGKGKITFPDGTFLDGYFNWGVIKGKRTLPGPTVIEGDLRQGQLNGQGKMTYRWGEVEEGVFEYGRFLHK